MWMSAPDPFERVAFLIGRWEGTAEGQPGKGTVRHEYSRVDEFEEIFELAESGKPFEVYSRSRLKRVR